MLLGGDARQSNELEIPCIVILNQFLSGSRIASIPTDRRTKKDKDAWLILENAMDEDLDNLTHLHITILNELDTGEGNTSLVSRTIEGELVKPL